MQKKINELTNTVNELNDELETERNIKAQLESEIASLNAQVDSWKKKAEDGDITIQEKNTEISKLNNEITAKNKELSDKGDEITELTSDKNRLETQVANLESSILEKDETIKDQNATIEEKTAKINELDGKLTNLNARVAELDQSIEKLNGQLEEANTDKEKLEGQVESLTSDKNRLETQVSDLQKQVSDKDTTIAELNTTISQKEIEISGLNEQIKNMNADITKQTNEINELNELVTTRTSERDEAIAEKNRLTEQVAKLEQDKSDLEKYKTGDAVAGDVLAGKTFSTANGAGLTGTMPNQGDATYEPEWYSLPSNRILTLPSGYYSSIKIDVKKIRQQGRDSVHPGIVTYREGSTDPDVPILERYENNANYSRVTITTPATGWRRILNIIAIDVSKTGQIATSVFTQTAASDGAYIYNYGKNAPGTVISNLDDLKPNTKYIIETKKAQFEEINQTAVYIVKDGYVVGGFPFPITSD